jgi:hypothetical protein
MSQHSALGADYALGSNDFESKGVGIIRERSLNCHL